MAATIVAVVLWTRPKMAQWCPQRTRGYTFSMRTFDMGENIIHTLVSKSWCPNILKIQKHITVLRTLFVENFGIVFRNTINGNMIWNNTVHHGWVNYFTLHQPELVKTCWWVFHLLPTTTPLWWPKKVAQISWFHNMSLEYIHLNGMYLSTSDNIHQITCW